MQSLLVNALNARYFVVCTALNAILGTRSALFCFGIVLLLCPFFFTGCAASRESATEPFSPTGYDRRSEVYGDEISSWNDTGSGGSPKIVINLDEQRAYFCRGKDVVGVSAVSTGREGHDTPSGRFSVTEKDPTHVSSIYGDYVSQDGQIVMENVDLKKDPRPRGSYFRGAPMPYFLRIRGGIGMHAGYLPGYPASHGCIRLPKEMAARFFENAAVGTPVIIRHSAPAELSLNPAFDQRFVPASY